VAIQGARYIGVPINVDGQQFQGCEFTQCSIIFSGIAPVGFIGCTFTGCSFNFSGPAQLMLDYLASIYGFAMPDGRSIVETMFDSVRSNAQEMAAAAASFVAGRSHPIDES
jgi:hypothetical protein